MTAAKITVLTAEKPLAGIRVLSMEQAAALPLATRHLADLGAEVIRVESPSRGSRGFGDDIEFIRNKKQLGIDLTSPDGPAAFRRVAAGCDIVCHNFTPRVVRKFGIDYDAIRAVKPDTIYLELTGFGTTGPWSERPLFGPGAEAVSGHNLLIGDPDAWPGRPATIFYADNMCGLYSAAAILQALERRDVSGRGSHLDISLYEVAVSQLGTVLADRALGADPVRNRNLDAAFAFQGVYPTVDSQRYVAMSVPQERVRVAAEAVGSDTDDEAGFVRAIATRSAEDVVARLQGVEVPAAIVSDAAELSTDPHLWARGFFGELRRDIRGTEDDFEYPGPPFGGGAHAKMALPHALGADSREILSTVGGYSASEVEALMSSGAVGEPAPGKAAPAAPDAAIRIERGELERVDEDFRDRLRAAKHPDSSQSGGVS